jgi:ATP/maltotriose-dependent transcriptional regulator MalT
LIARHWISYVDRWRIVTVRSWLRALPEEVVRADPVLTLVSAWIALSFEETAEVDHWLANSTTAVPSRRARSRPAWRHTA